jgi:hypothetical protein
MKDDSSKLSMTVRRQAIFDRCAARYREAGTPLDENERFMMAAPMIATAHISADDLAPFERLRRDISLADAISSDLS